MKKIILLLLTFGILFASSINAETVLYCKSELATGFAKVDGKWKIGNFAPARFTIKFNDNFSRIEGGLPESSPMECDVPFDSLTNVIHCVSTNYNRSTMRYDIESKRFVHYFNPARGYISSSADTDLLYAGTCEIF
tara:strand:- start:515 stop:922 length:408 start_codon:yes stop_codon:yes gene_type:complete